MWNEQTLAARFHEHGLRPTPQRSMIYRYLLEHRTHPTADTIYAALAPHHPSLSRTTVYNTLHCMEKAGLIRVLPADAIEQEFRYDADVSSHGHFYCRQCGLVLDFTINDQQLTALTPLGVEVEGGNVMFCGRCSACCEENS